MLVKGIVFAYRLQTIANTNAHPWEPIITDLNYQRRFFFQLPPCIRIPSPPWWSKSTAFNTIEVSPRFCMRTSCLEQQLRVARGWWEPRRTRWYAPFAAHFSPASASILPHGRKQVNIARENSHWVLQRSRLSLSLLFGSLFIIVSLFFLMLFPFSLRLPISPFQRWRESYLFRVNVSEKRVFSRRWWTMTQQSPVRLFLEMT